MGGENEALRLLEGELAVKERDVDQLRQVVEQLRERVLGQSPERPASSEEFARVGVTEAARRVLREAGEPMSTRALCDGLRARGLRSRSKNLEANVYATLKNNRTFERVDGVAWKLKEVATHTEPGR